MPNFSGVWTLQEQYEAVLEGNWPEIVKQELYAWGQGNYGNLGLGTTVSYSSPVQVGALSTWSQVSIGRRHSAGVNVSGELYVWGDNSKGQLGTNNTINTNSPVQLGALTTWSQVSVSGSYADHSSFAVKTDGTLWAWGSNDYGRLGINISSTVDVSSPVQVGALTSWSQVSAGTYHTIAVKTDGTLWIWGANPVGQLGVNDTAHRSSPVQVGALTTWSQVSGGGFHTLAVKTDGTLWAWGRNNVVQLGDGSLTNRSSPVQIGALTTWSQTSAGYQSSSAVKTDGTIWGWGFNGQGQVGDNSITNRNSPVQLGSDTDWSKVEGGANHTMALKTTGELYAWGDSTPTGQIGDNAAINRSSPVQIGALTAWSDIAAGNYKSLALFRIT